MTQKSATPLYRELAPARDLREHVLCGWVLGPVSRDTEAVLPDGCMDIVWREGHGLVAAGPDTGPAQTSRPPGSTVVGIRFRPGAGPAMLGVPAGELRDLRVPLGDLWGSDAERLEDGLHDAASASARLELLDAALRRRLGRADYPDGLVAAAVARLSGDRRTRVREIGETLGISERQLRRRFHAAVGYGPKTLARVLRLQRMLGLAAARTSERPDLASLALDAGYADQAHMTAESTTLTGKPPARLLASRQPLTASA
ncbi:MAG: DUF6597 domain-containing transcriptional factor [Solirubrobacterales bacterium]